MAKLAPIFNDAQLIDGIPATGGLLFTYAADSSTKQSTFTDEAGTTPQSNPIVLNARGEPDSPIWLTEGLSYKFVFAPSDDTDPPSSAIRTFDDVSGINDASISVDQWLNSGLTPTYVNATQFTLPGDQTSAFQVNRRIKATVTAGTVYGYISVSAYTSLTTVTVVLDSGALDVGLSAVQLGLITPENTSLPNVALDAYPVGSIYMSVLSTSPATLFGGTWSAFAEGRALVGLDSGNTLMDTAEEEFGQADAVNVSHTHAITDPTHSHAVYSNGGATSRASQAAVSAANTATSSQTANSSTGITINSAGESATDKNYQPSIAVYMWKRTA